MKNKIEGTRYWANRPVTDERRDWRNGAPSWIDEYVASVSHPHRDLVLKSLKKFKGFKSLLEVGCNAGPNLIRIREVYPKVRLMGVDVNYDAVVRAMEVVPNAIIRASSVERLPFEDKSFDVVLADAVLMYVDNVAVALSEIDRVTNRGIILFDWFAEEACIKDFHYARNYPKLLDDLGFDTKVINLTEKTWPSEKWIKNGRLFISHRRSPTGQKS